MKLEQSRFWVHRKFELTDFGVRISYKDLRKENEFEVSYKSIKGDRHRELDGYFAFYVIFRICSIGWLISFFAAEVVEWISYRDTLIIALLGITSLLIYYLSRQDLIKIAVDDETNIYFLKNRPNETDVNRFINLMIERRDNLLRKMYLDFDELDSYENQKYNLNILFNYKVINQEEFEEEKKRLKRLFKIKEPDQYEIGFK